MSSRNTKEQGLVEFSIFEDNGRYAAVCLTFDIVLEGDDPVVLKEEIVKAAQLHLQTVAELGLPDELLNRHAPKEFYDKRDAALAPKPHERFTQGSYERSTYTREEGILTAC